VEILGKPWGDSILIYLITSPWIDAKLHLH
jgi:hypothetical protein